MKNPLHWLFLQPKQYFYIIMCGWMIYMNIDFMIDHPQHIFLYYVMIVLSCVYLVEIIYFIISFKKPEYHKIVWGISALFFALSLSLRSLIYPKYGKISIYVAIISGCFLLGVALFAIINNKKLNDFNS